MRKRHVVTCQGTRIDASMPGQREILEQVLERLKLAKRWKEFAQLQELIREGERVQAERIHRVVENLERTLEDPGKRGIHSDAEGWDAAGRKSANAGGRWQRRTPKGKAKPHVQRKREHAERVIVGGAIRLARH